jgi:hypothetical protein
VFPKLVSVPQPDSSITSFPARCIRMYNPVYTTTVFKSSYFQPPTQNLTLLSTHEPRRAPERRGRTLGTVNRNQGPSFSPTTTDYAPRLKLDSHSNARCLDFFSVFFSPSCRLIRTPNCSSMHSESQIVIFDGCRICGRGPS